MRDILSWQRDLRAELTAVRDLYGPLAMGVNTLLEVELVLTLLHDYLPNEEPRLAWIILNGQPFPALLTQPAAVRQAVGRARQLLSTPLSRRAWTQWLDQYKALPSPYPLYRIEDNRVAPTGTALVAARLDRLRAVLSSPVPWTKLPAKYAEAGFYRFTVDHEPYEVEIPGRLARPVHQSASVSPGQRTRPELSVRLADLEAEADWMDRVTDADAARWGTTMRKIRLRLVTQAGLTPTETLTIDGLLHLIGMVGSGKSTLMTVLAVYCARRGQRVMLVYGEVATILREFAQFEQFRQHDDRLSAVPIIGRSSRAEHLNRLHLTDARQHGLTLDLQHPGYHMLSTICPLDGLRRDVPPLKLGHEPCTRLYVRGEREAEPARRDCPLMAQCPVHMPFRELTQASIVLTTPAGLLATATQTPLIDEPLRMVEYAMRSIDLLLIDEADLVQVQFDARFAQIQVLVGEGESWLDRLYQQVAIQVYRPGRPLVGSPPVDRWLAAHANTQRAVDALYRWVREDGDIRYWLRQRFFTGDRLMRHFQEDIRQIDLDPTPLDSAIDSFLNDPLGKGHGEIEAGPPTVWVDAARRTLLGDDLVDIRASLVRWLDTHIASFADQPLPTQERMTHRLIIAIIVTVLDHALRDMLLAWPSAAERLDLNRGSGSLFFAPADSIARLIPEPPMGAVLGFQYYASDDHNSGELRFFQVRAMGRALLTHIHDALHLTDSVVGPHVVLTSGTSWAPGSWRYHLPVPPQVVLLPEHRDEDAELTCFFTPIPHPDPKRGMLVVSGVEHPNERLNNLRDMVRYLARRSGLRGKSPFEHELDQLPPERRRILLVVGSYVQAEAVAKTLSDALGKAPGEAVVALIPDGEGDLDLPSGYLLRSMLPHFPSLDAQYLIAPLQAIERGHNILVGQEAAIGSVYFLTRPMPVPGDPYAAVQRVNAWADEVVQTLQTPTIGEAGLKLRAEGGQHWNRELRRDESYRGTADGEALLWTQLVLIWQCIGRLLRGGVPARVHFVDAKWAEVSANLVKGDYDTTQTSMLVGFRTILEQAISDANPARRAIAETLYGSLARALRAVRGLRTEESL